MEARSTWKREVWCSKLENKAKAYQRHRDFVSTKKPWIWPFYRFRRLVDDLLKYGGPQAKGVLESIPHFRYDERCKICGSTKNLQAFWPDYSQPQTIWRYCSYHRKIEAFGDTRTLAQQDREAAKGKEEITRIRKLLLDAGLSQWKLVEEAKGKAS
jgi:ribosomal protein S18